MKGWVKYSQNHLKMPNVVFLVCFLVQILQKEREEFVQKEKTLRADLANSHFSSDG